MKNNSNIIIKFDGLCNFCSYWIQYLIKNDHKKIFSFINDNQYDSIVVIFNKNKYYNIDAIKIILENIPISPIVNIFFNYSPKFILNILYNIFSKNRYLLFGKRKTCYIPKNK